MIVRDGKPRCEATTRYVPGPYGLTPATCHQHVGLRWVEGHAYCTAPGHEANVRGKVRRLVPA